jgi:hypothetical protein
MRGNLADINVGRQHRVLLSVCTSIAWRDIWTSLNLSVESFPTLGLSFDSPDSLVWKTCQQEQLVLVTGNRNKRGSESLESVIESENQPDSLPVITIADTKRVLQDRSYAELVAERLLDYLMRIDEVRGAGRIYIP